MSFILLDMICSLNTLMQDKMVGWSDVTETARTCILPAKLGYLNDDSTIKELDAREQFELAWKDLADIYWYETRLFRTVARR